MLSSSASLHLPVIPFADDFSSFFIHATISLQSPSHTLLYQAPGSTAAVLQSPVIPNTTSFSTQSVHSCPFYTGPRCPAFAGSPDMILLGNLWSPMRSRAPAYNSLLVHTIVWILLHPVHMKESLTKRCGCLTMCTRFRGLFCDVQYGACCSGPWEGSMLRIRTGDLLLLRVPSDLPSGGRTVPVCNARSLSTPWRRPPNRWMKREPLLYYLGFHPTCLRAVEQFPLETPEAHPPRADPPADLGEQV